MSPAGTCDDRVSSTLEFHRSYGTGPCYCAASTEWTRLATLRCALALAALACSAVGAAEPDLPLFIGQKKCLSCHGEGTSAGRCSLESIPPHDRTVQALERPLARHIAAISGIHTPPTESRICLDCHATGADDGPRWWAESFRFQDGVQCEACHGVGSTHASTHRSGPLAGGLMTTVWLNGIEAVMLATSSRLPAGAPSPSPLSIRRGDRADCSLCHVERPSHREVVERGFRLAPEDRVYKTPVNLALSVTRNELYVACEQADSVLVIELDNRTVKSEIPVGRRPHGLALSPDERFLYVANRMDSSVSVIDVAEMRLIDEIHVGSEPHGVAVDPLGGWILVANTGENTVSVLDPSTRQEVKRLVTGTGPWGIAIDGLRRRAYVTSVRPQPGRFREPPRSEITVIDMTTQTVLARPIAEEANMLEGVTVLPDSGIALITLMRTKNLIPTSRVAQGWVITNGLGLVRLDGRVDQVLLDESEECFPDPTSIAVSPDGRTALITSGGSDQLAIVDLPALLEVIQEVTVPSSATSQPPSDPSTRRHAEMLANHLGMSQRFVRRRIPVGRNPRSALFSADGRYAYIANALDDTISVVDLAGLEVVDTIELGGPKMISEVRAGERLFHSAAQTYARQFSCRSCHPDGHMNGLAFDIEADGIGMYPVDNRTLRGIFDTPPFKWEGTNPSLHRQCGPRLAVFFTRVSPYSSTELDALVRYM